MGIVGSACCASDRKLSPEILKLMAEATCQKVFQKPCQPVGAAGGTADFFNLVIADSGNPEESNQEWLGKDLSRASDELEFYIDAQKLRGVENWELLDATIEYAGVLRDFPCRFSDWDTRAVDLLVMRSLLEGLEHPRLLDLKVGAKTADANWQGKSRFAAWQQGVVDNHTNSGIEGVRLEGFMNPPAWVESEDPLHDVGGQGWCGKKAYKRARRVAFQRMTMAEVFLACFDLRGCLETKVSGIFDVSAWQTALSSAEYAELVVLHVVRQCGLILRDCAALPIPQKWIGSSVAVVVEAETTPPRQNLSAQKKTDEHSVAELQGEPPQDWVSRRTRVQLFDWGRSELNTPERHSKLKENDQKNRAAFWSLYQEGICTLLFEATRLYFNSFCVASWSTLELTVYDYDSQTANDFLGTAKVDLPDMQNATSSPQDLSLELVDKDGKPVGHSEIHSKVEVSLRFERFPGPSRLQGAWLVHVKSAKDLLAKDVGLCPSSDPMAVVTMWEPGGRNVSARTSVVETNLNPAWTEVLEFAVASAPSEGVAGTAELLKALQPRAQKKDSPMVSLPEQVLTRMPGLGVRHRSTKSEHDHEIFAFLDCFFAK